jgi:hypothetical protein
MREWSNIVKGYSTKLEREQKAQWEIARQIAFASAAYPHGVIKGTKATTFMPFFWDAEEQEGVISDLERKIEEQKNIDKQWEEYDRQIAEKNGSKS